MINLTINGKPSVIDINSVSISLIVDENLLRDNITFTNKNNSFRYHTTLNSNVFYNKDNTIHLKLCKTNNSVYNLPVSAIFYAIQNKDSFDNLNFYINQIKTLENKKNPQFLQNDIVFHLSVGYILGKKIRIKTKIIYNNSQNFEDKQERLLINTAFALCKKINNIRAEAVFRNTSYTINNFQPIPCCTSSLRYQVYETGSNNNHGNNNSKEFNLDKGDIKFGFLYLNNYSKIAFLPDTYDKNKHKILGLWVYNVEDMKHPYVWSLSNFFVANKHLNNGKNVAFMVLLLPYKSMNPQFYICNIRDIGAMSTYKIMISVNAHEYSKIASKIRPQIVNCALQVIDSDDRNEMEKLKHIEPESYFRVGKFEEALERLNLSVCNPEKATSRVTIDDSVKIPLNSNFSNQNSDEIMEIKQPENCNLNINSSSEDDLTIINPPYSFVSDISEYKYCSNSDDSQNKNTTNKCQDMGIKYSKTDGSKWQTNKHVIPNEIKEELINLHYNRNNINSTIFPEKLSVHKTGNDTIMRNDLENGKCKVEANKNIDKMSSNNPEKKLINLNEIDMSLNEENINAVIRQAKSFIVKQQPSMNTSQIPLTFSNELNAKLDEKDINKTDKSPSNFYKIPSNNNNSNNIILNEFNKKISTETPITMPQISDDIFPVNDIQSLIFTTIKYQQREIESLRHKLESMGLIQEEFKSLNIPVPVYKTKEIDVQQSKIDKTGKTDKNCNVDNVEDKDTNSKCDAITKTDEKGVNTGASLYSSNGPSCKFNLNPSVKITKHVNEDVNDVGSRKNSDALNNQKIVEFNSKDPCQINVQTSKKCDTGIETIDDSMVLNNARKQEKSDYANENDSFFQSPLISKTRTLCSCSRRVKFKDALENQEECIRVYKKEQENYFTSNSQDITPKRSILRSRENYVEYTITSSSPQNKCSRNCHQHAVNESSKLIKDKIDSITSKYLKDNYGDQNIEESQSLQTNTKVDCCCNLDNRRARKSLNIPPQGNHHNHNTKTHTDFTLYGMGCSTDLTIHTKAYLDKHGLVLGFESKGAAIKSNKCDLNYNDKDRYKGKYNDHFNDGSYILDVDRIKKMPKLL
ncbi:putative uncharacterized protein DDB_G0282133 [Gordionus sp. m RMFG-2023]|uniref:putative uncharacterized protein DDB_G0282133 n=1 Tax=Gordionus sp. m RMFG-2023 TaxID=3053472 RepID=UPI0031FE34EC